MPEIGPVHKIDFHVMDEGSDIVLPSIPNPVYIYRVGDKFRFFSSDTPDPNIMVKDFKVVKVTQELQEYGVGEQCVVVHVKEIKEDANS